MPQSLSAVYIHAVFSTKNREPWLGPAGLLSDTHAYLGGVSGKLGCNPILVGGMADHVHMLCAMGRTITIADWLKEVKRVSSLWMKESHSDMAAFAWQNGYGAFSVSASQLPAVRDYIATQEEHHRKRTFQDEFRGLLTKHDIAWDEKYVWD